MMARGLLAFAALAMLVAASMQARAVLRHTGSAAANIRTYSSDVFEIGEVVAWIFNNELAGYRIK